MEMTPYGNEVFSITATGPGSTALQAKNGGVVKVAGAPGRRARVEASGERAGGALVESAGRLELIHADVNVADTSQYAFGLAARGEGSSILVDDSTIAVAGHVLPGQGSTVYGVGAASGAIVTVNNSRIETTGRRAHGVNSALWSTIFLDNTNVSTAGEISRGVFAYTDSLTREDWARVVINGGSVTTGRSDDRTQAAKAVALSAWGIGSLIQAQGVTVTTHSDLGHGAWAFYGGDIHLGSTGTPASRSTISTGGHGAVGLLASGDSGVYDWSTGAYVPGSENVAEAIAHYVDVSTSGEAAPGIAAGHDDGYPGGTLVFGSGTVRTSGAHSFGARAWYDGRMTLRQSSVTTSGVSAHGLYVGTAFIEGAPEIYGGFTAYELYHQGDILGSKLSADNVTVKVNGDGASAAYATESGDLDIVNSALQSESGSGVVVDRGGSASVSGGSITSRGTNAAALQVGGAGTSLVVADTLVEARGTGAVAAKVRDGGSLAIKGGVLSSLQGAAIQVVDAATVSVTGAVLNSANAASIASTLNSAATQDITIGAGTTLTNNNGTLLEVRRSGDGQDGIVNLTLEAGSIASGDIIERDLKGPNGKVNFNVLAGARWSGNAGSTLSDLGVDKGASVVQSNDLALGGNLDIGSEAQVALLGDSSIGGGVQAAPGADLRFSGTTSIARTLDTTGASVLFSSGAQVGETVRAQRSSSILFNSDARIGGDVRSESSRVVFQQRAEIGGSVGAQGASTIVFAGPARVGAHNSQADSAVQSNGGAMIFQGDADITGSVAVTGSGASIQFGRDGLAQSRIDGALLLEGGAIANGGARGNPVRVLGGASVGSGATLGGNMSIAGNVDVSGGVLAPGNSVGTLEMDSLALSGLNGYVAEVNAQGASDLIVVNRGTVDLSAIDLQVKGENGRDSDALLNWQYTLIQAEDGFSGQFNSVQGQGFEGTLARLGEVRYGTHSVQVGVEVDQAKVATLIPSLSDNQAALLRVADSVQANRAVSTLILEQTDPAHFDQVSGEAHSSVKGAMANGSRHLRDTLTERMRTVLDRPATSANEEGEMWVSLLGGGERVDGDDVEELSTSTNGLLLGGDMLFGNGWRIGGALGVSQSNHDVDDLGSHADADSLHIGAYGGTRWERLAVRLGAGYSLHDLSMERSVAFADYRDRLTSNYDVGVGQLFVDLGYRIEAEQGRLEPFANLAYVNLRSDGFTEQGGDAALHGEADTLHALFSTLGLRGTTSIAVDSSVIDFSGGVGWRHAFGHEVPTSTVSFDTGDSFEVDGVAISEDAAVLDLGMGISITRALTVDLNYSGLIGSDASDHAVKVGASFKF